MFSALTNLRMPWKNAAHQLTEPLKRLTFSERIQESISDLAIVCVTTPVFMTGQIIQNYPSEFPRFLRWHLTNMVDVPAIAIPINVAFIIAAGKSRPVASSAFVFGLGIAYKMWESHLPGRSFDYTDTACFAAGMLAYISVRRPVSKFFTKTDTTLSS